MNLFFGLKIPLFIIYLSISALVTGFIFWRGRKNLKLRKVQVFDFILVYIIFSILIGRIFYIIENFDQFSQLSWSIYPFYYLPGAERVWFKQMPWVLLKFWDSGFIPSAMLLGGIIYSVVFFLRRKIPLKFTHIIVSALCLGQIVQIFFFFVNSDYFGKVTDLWFGVRYSDIDSNLRIPIQIIEIAVLVALLVSLKYIEKLKKGILGVYFFLFGWLEVIIPFMVEGGEGGVSFVQIVYLVFVFIGILIMVFSYQQDKEVVAGPEQAVPAVMGKGIDVTRSSKLQFGYRDFQSSSPTYKGVKRSFLGSIKNKLSKRRNKDELASSEVRERSSI